MITSTQNIITMLVAMVIGGVVGGVIQFRSQTNSSDFVIKEEFSENNIPSKMINTDVSIDEIIEDFELIKG